MIMIMSEKNVVTLHAAAELYELFIIGKIKHQVKQLLEEFMDAVDIKFSIIGQTRRSAPTIFD